MQPSVLVAAVLGLSLILSVGIYVTGRVRTERERTLQRLLERGVPVDDLMKVAGREPPGVRDLRRGVLLLATGATWSVATFLIGGRAWLFGFVPLALGAVYLLFWVLHGRRS
jgi:hypothetical protein